MMQAEAFTVPAGEPSARISSENGQQAGASLPTLPAMELEPNHCHAILQARDTRYDGHFFVGVTSTGVYCRPVCRVRTPRAENCRYYPHAAAAEAAGFRPCLRCRPELAPDDPNRDGDDLAERAWRQIQSGALNDGSVADLARQLDISERHLHRCLEQRFGVGPLALAQTQRLLLAKQLLTDTDQRLTDVAMASGFSSLRRFNAAFKAAYRMPPSRLRQHQRISGKAESADSFTLHLAYRPPLNWASLSGFLASRGALATERLDGQAYVRSVQIGNTLGWLRAQPRPGSHQIAVQLSASLLPHTAALLPRLRHLFDLDANPTAIDAHLQCAPLLAPWVARSPGLRIPGCLDGFDVALRAVLGQQISVKAATTVYGRFADFFGAVVSTPFEGLKRCTPTAEVLADSTQPSLIERGLTRRRADTILALARAVADGQLRLDPGQDRAAVRETLLALPGIGPWTAEYVALRALGDCDALPDSDLGLYKAVGVQRPQELRAAAESWRPWRGYAALHLWQGLSSGG